jgi:Ca-activated chloride channel homolog
MGKGVIYYDVLGVSRDAPPEDIRGAFFDAAKRLHPDANPDPSAREAFLIVQEAYEVLINPQKRAAYDSFLPQNQVAASVAVNIKYSRSRLPCLDEAQLVYVLLELICTAEQTQINSPPVNICLVIDRSTSMKGERMDMVKANITHLIRQLKPNDYLSVVAYSDRAVVVIPTSTVVDPHRLEHEVSLISTEGGTEMLQGLEAGISQLRAIRSKDIIRHLILLTDGHTYGDEEACLEIAQRAAQDGITISAMGIGHEWNDAFLDKMTGLCGGNALYASTPEDLFKYMEQKLTTIEKVYAKGVTFKFQNDERIQPRFIFRLYPEIAPLPVTSPIYFGNLLYGRSLTVLFEFLVQKIQQPIDRLHLASGYLEMDVINQGGVLQFLDIHRPAVENPEPELPPAPIVEAMSRLTLYRLQEKARVEVGQGEAVKASKHLQYLATHLLSNGNHELAHTVLMEAEHIRQSQRFSKDGDKRIKYGTRALLLPPGLERKKL